MAKQQFTNLQTLDAEDVLLELRKTKSNYYNVSDSVNIVRESKKTIKKQDHVKLAKNKTYKHNGIDLLKPFFSGKPVKYLSLLWLTLFGLLISYQSAFMIRNQNFDNSVSASSLDSIIITSTSGDTYYNLFGNLVKEQVAVSFITLFLLGLGGIIVYFLNRLKTNSQ